jgi:MoaA/NifB/PqqE/SkfB family radical SAM enzyme
MPNLLERIREDAINIVGKGREAFLMNAIGFLLRSRKGRQILLEKAATEGRDMVYSKSKSKVEYFKKVQAQYLVALIDRFNANIEKGFLSPGYAAKILERMIKGMFYSGVDTAEKFAKKHGFTPPGTCTVSPGQACNLRCTGCYAASTASTRASLPFGIVDRLVTEMHDDLGSRFMVVSGGEPFMWNDNGKGILDIAAKFKDMYFLAYTNGTLLNQEKIERLKECANLTPAISVEGFEAETDKRRGPGVYQKIWEVMEELKKQGVAYGLSVTATRENADLLMQEDFYDFWFSQGASFMWFFHLMPIGRARETTHLAITPEQRKGLLEQWERMLFQKNYFIGDFWNAAASSDGCIGYGRGGGYFYVDWNGNVNPCVFVPYHENNLYDMYQNGKTLADALSCGLFKRGRAWQGKQGMFTCQPKNIFTPCSIRDHYADFRGEILGHDAVASDKTAQEALEDPEYYKYMVDFGEKLGALTADMWEKRLNAPPRPAVPGAGSGEGVRPAEGGNA